MKYRFVIAAFCLLSVGSLANEFYASKALNPVKFSKAAEHADIPLVRNGELNFVIVCDLAPEKKKMHREWASVTLPVGFLQGG